MHKPDPGKHHHLLPATSAEATAQQCLHELVEAQAAERPGACAVRLGKQELTYQELNERANQVAHYLRQQGVGPEVRVGICLERSLEMVIGLLGILKAGGTYVPLDPAYPAERLRFMIEDTSPRLVLALQRLHDRLPKGSHHTSTIVCLDTDWALFARQNTTNPLSGTTAANVAYIMYTSGSTGRPKGVMVSHHAIMNRLRWAQSETPLMPTDRVIQLTSFSFDISIWELFGPWMAGAMVLLADSSRQTDREYLIHLLVEQQVTVAHFVPSLLQLLLEAPGLEACASLRWVFCGGEAVPVSLPQRLLTRLPVSFYQFYGPTEAAISATWWMYSGESTLTSLPIGKPITNMQTYVLDANWQPIPPGVSGELYLGGEGLAYGYLDRADITAERFIPNPFSTRAGERLYRTGDLARYLPDGNLEFLGRNDQQVKIRGIRVELGEIETVLSQHPAVSEAIVAAHEDSLGDKRLVAYLVRRASGGEAERLTDSTMRQYLRERLPNPLVPAAYVWLEKLPLTPNGKVDRRALPAPTWGQKASEGEQTPQTPIEEALAVLWSEVLGMPPTGRQANFFECGGHSLLAARLVSRIRRRFEIDLPIRAIFESPTLSSLAERIEQSQRAGHPQLRPLIHSIPHAGEVPLTFEQEQLWFLAQLEPANPAYNISLALDFDGPLDVPALEASLNALLVRHESLRTCFREVQDRPVQMIVPLVHLALPLHDWSELAATPTAQEALFEQMSQQQTARPFDLEAAPLLRAQLARFNAEKHRLLLTIHHLIFDGWSQEVLLREVSALYQAALMGTPHSLPSLQLQYADYARWQRLWLHGEVLAAELAYWQEEVAGAPTRLELPADRSRFTESSFQGATLPFTMQADLAAAIFAMCQREGATPYMVLLAGLEILLSRYSGQNDFLLGTPVDTRSQVETEGLIGLLINTLVLRADVSEQPAGRELLRRVRERVLRAQTHPDFPLSKLVEALQPERQGNATPLVQIAFAWEETSPVRKFAPGVEVHLEPWPSQSSKFEITFFAWEEAGKLAGKIEYDSALYESATIERLVSHWQQALAGLVHTPETPIGQLPLLTAAEWEQQVQQWNQTEQAFPREVCLHELVEQQALERPQATAIRWADGMLTYRQLNERANQLAHHLRQLGVGPEVRVGVCLERSADLIVSLLAILKAGGVYVPLDPMYPAERLAFMVAHAQMALVLTQHSMLEHIPPTVLPVTTLETLQETLAQKTITNLGSLVSAQNLAYVMYTSGSTGQPKGIAITHRNIVRLVFQPTYVQIRNTDVFLQLASAAFDAATFEIWGSLVNGATLVLAPTALPSHEELALLLSQYQVSILWLTAGFFHQMVEMHLEGLRPVRHLLAGGEALSAPHVHQAAVKLPGCQLINGYGPTENTTFSCCYPVHPADPLIPSVPIGRPIGNTQAYVLDEQLQPVPVGVVGELYLGGEGLARGYLGRPDLTAGRFLPHPFSAQPGTRLYRTGDLVRFRSNGTLLFVGRRDGQIKLRGYRIECEEIEHWLAQHPLVQSAVVMLREDQPGDKRLVAYLLPHAQPGERLQTATSAVRQFLRERLPDYMVPAAYLWLEALPLTRNGKIDRRALPAPTWDQGASEDEQGPQTPTEEVLAGQWAEVLGVKSVSRQANFFELGGHSLLATRLISRVRRLFQINLPVRALFEAPTVAGLAQILPHYEAKPGQIETIARLHIQVNALSAEELEARLREKKERG